MFTIKDYSFTVNPLNKADGGGWIVEYPDLHGCIGTGDTVAEALDDAKKAKEAWIESAIAEGISLP